MGFCRRCGDIVVGPRCKCGGTSVAPVVKWNQEDGQANRDQWSKTYVTRDKSPPKPVGRLNTGSQSNPVPFPSTSEPPQPRRFPRPTPHKPAISLDSAVSEHINASAAPARPSSPLKHSTSFSFDDETTTSAKAAEGILPNLNSGSRLAKVYGSVLQSPESLSNFICSLCSTPFPPDATIYPDPSSVPASASIDDHGSATRFLCRPCFTANGGSKGTCPACFKPVLILKSEGGFVENSGKVWHKKCFCCEGCNMNIGDNPMVDLLGRPSCADCFESCLRRPSGTTPRKARDSDTWDVRNNLGGTLRNSKSREGSPALEELEMRLGIKSRDSTPTAAVRTNKPDTSLRSSVSQETTSPSPFSRRYTGTLASGDGSPTAERLAARARANSAGSPARDAATRYRSPEIASPDGSPVSRRTYNRFRTPEPEGPPSARSTSSPRYGSPAATHQPTEDAIEEMKQRFLRQASPGPPSNPRVSETTPTTTPKRRSRSRPRSSITPSAPRIDGLPTSTSSEAVFASVKATSSPADATLRLVRKDSTGATDYTLKRDRTGDAEVESLLGRIPRVPTGDLIDFSPDASFSSYTSSIGSQASRIPRLTRTMTSPELERIGLEFGLSTSTPRSSLGTDYTRFAPSVPATPELASDISDVASVAQSSAPSTPPSLSPPSRRGAPDKNGITSQGTGNSYARSPNAYDSTTLNNTPTPKSRTQLHDLSIHDALPADSRCAKCRQPLFSMKHGGKFVTVPEQPSVTGVQPKTYHTACFRCTICDGVFDEHEGGKAVFVRIPDGVAHPQCAPPERTVVRQYTTSFPSYRSTPAPSPTPARRETVTATYHPPSSSRYEPPPMTAPPTTQSFNLPQPRFGSATTCPGCNKNVSPMERGVVPGPQGARWHATCLICGGKDAKGRRREVGKPGCGKKLDSAAKTDREGNVWCRECLLLVPQAPRADSASPVRRSTPNAPMGHGPSHSVGSRGAFGTVAQQFTGTTTLARQFTGLGGGSDPAVLRQLTGGGLSPTRQLTSSPTKMFDGPRPGAGRYPRPKSAIGMRSSGEGRGMYLVRQLTGGKSNTRSDDDDDD